MPNMVMERPKMSRAMWESLKVHIQRERKRKKEEQEADAEEKRLRQERETKQKQNELTLEETKEQIAFREKRLGELKDEKHQLFMQLKKVLNEDETRRRQQMIKEANEMMAHGYPSNIPMGPHPQMFMQPPASMSNRVPTMYKVQNVHPQSMLPHQPTVKRQRSPSPPAQNYPQSYNYKNQSSIGPAYSQQKAAAATVGYSGNQQSNSYYHPQPTTQAHIISTVSSYQPSGTQPIYSYATAHAHPSAHAQFAPAQQQPAQDSKHGAYVQAGGRGYVGSLHQQLEHANQKAGFSAQESDKYYSSSHNPAVAVRPSGHIPIHSSVIPVQPPSQGSKTGGITSGYPVRGQPPHTTSSTAYPSRSSAPQTAYNSQPPPASRISHSQLPPGRYYNGL